MAKKILKTKNKTKVKSKLVKTVKNLSAILKTNGPKIVPLGSRVLIKPFTKDELTEKNSFGIILPDSGSKEKSEQGKVVAVGAGEWKDGKRLPVSVKVGETVAFSKYGYDDVTVDGEEYYLIKEENILAILK
jgi:chaperonin GroES